MRSLRLLTAVLLWASLVTPSWAGKQGQGLYRQLAAYRQRAARQMPVHTRGDAMLLAHQMFGQGPGGERITVAVLGAAVPEETIDAGLTARLTTLGQEVAHSGGILVTGACPGVPMIAQRAAYEAGGITVGISPARSLKDHTDSFKMTTAGMTIVQWTATGPGTGFIEREAPLIKAADILVVANGRSGTMGELAAGMYTPKVLAVLEDSGGVAGHARQNIIPHIGTGQAIVVYDSDPVRLLDKAKRALAQLKPTQLTLGKKSEKRSLPSSGLKVKMMHGMSKLEHESLVARPVYSLFTADRNLTDLDHARLKKLMVLIGTPRAGEQQPLLIGPARTGLTASMFEVARKAGAETLGVSGANSTKEHLAAGYGIDGFDRIELTGKGTGVGAFAALRPIVERSKIVFVAGGDHETLAGVVYASYHRNTILAVLDTNGMSGKLEHEITKTYDKPAQAMVIYDSDPVLLYERARAAAKQLEGEFRTAYIAAE